MVKSSCNTIIRVGPTDAHFPLDNDDGDGRPLSLERRILARNQKVFWVMEDRKGKGTAALREILYVKFPHHSLIKLLARLLIYHSRYLVKSTCPSITTRPQWTFPPKTRRLFKTAVACNARRRSRLTVPNGRHILL